MPHFTENDQQTLQNIDISYDAPGTILRDFDALLSFIGVKGVPLTAKNNVFPGKVLKPLNQEMTFPIVHNSIRAQFSSFPNLSGLLLLLRCAGFAIVGKKSVSSNLLILDENVVDSWRKLNYTEQYVSLLNRWLLHGAGSIIGEKADGVPLLQCHNFFLNYFHKNPKELDRSTIEYLVRYKLGASNLALLEMFGLTVITIGSSKTDKKSYVDHVSLTPLGGAIFNLLEPHIFDLALFNEDFDSVKSSPKTIKPIIQSYFPAFHNFLKPAHQVFQEGPHLFKVSLGEIWRRILISGQMTFEELSDTILSAFKFDQDDHGYRFSRINRYGLEISISDASSFSDEEEASEVAIGDLTLLPGENLNYLFDFGAGWEFAVHLESVNASDNTLRKPRIVEKHGKAPEQYSSREEW